MSKRPDYNGNKGKEIKVKNRGMLYLNCRLRKIDKYQMV